MKTRKTRWYHRLFYRWSSPYRFSVEKALNTMLHKGIGIGMRQVLSHSACPYDAPLPVVFCDECGTQVLLADALYCRHCGARLPAITGPQVQIHKERITGPTLHVPPGALVQAFHQSPGGMHTKLHAAINKVQLVGMQREKVS